MIESQIQPRPEEGSYQFSPDFVSWCANCDSPFHYFQASSCSFIYHNKTYQAAEESDRRAEKLIVGFYCPDCEEALSQAQPTFATTNQEEAAESQHPSGLAEEWRYPTDEELEDALEWATERV